MQQWIYAQRPDTAVGAEHYRLEPISDLAAPVRGEVIVEGRYWSVDPYMRIQQSAGNTWEAPHPVGEVQGGAVVGQVTEVGEGVTELAPGDWVETYMGWRTHGLRPVAECRKLDPDAAPVSTALHVLGMPGRIAWFGLMEAGKPQPGDKLLVSGAAGAVGSIVGQIGKLAGCHVTGVVGSADKADWITRELGFDAAINYREARDAEAMASAIRETAGGVDIYYDNTGGPTTDAVFETMNLRARLIICGQISQYQGGLDTPNPGPRLLHTMLYKRATMTGVLARDYTHRMDEMLAKMAPWVASGAIKYRETRMKGFEALPDALAALFTGGNTGKMIVEA